MTSPHVNVMIDLGRVRRNAAEVAARVAGALAEVVEGFCVFSLAEAETIGLWRLTGKPAIALGPSGEVIPNAILVRPPSAELRENQKDQDSLPPYDVLDAILERLVEREEPLAAIVAAGFDREVVARIDHLLNIAEYKRRQAAPGVKVTEKNFGRDRRYPITNRFRDLGQALPQPDEKLVTRGSRASVEAFDD